MSNPVIPQVGQQPPPGNKHRESVPGGSALHPGGPGGPAAVAGSLGVSAIVLVTVVTVLTKGPLFLPGAMGELLERDIGLGPRQIGFIIALYWVGSIGGAYASRHADEGGIVERRIGIALGATSLALLAAGLWPRVGLWAGAAVGGVVYGYTQPHTNYLLVRRCAPRVHALAFGIKQASIPLATLLCAVAVPAVALPLGWRPLLLLVGVLGAAQAIVMMRGARRRGVRWRARVDNSRPPLNRHLLALAAAGACGAAVGNSLGGFLISSLASGGGTLVMASLVAAAGSLTAVVVRIAVGWGIDRRPRYSQRLLGLLFLVGVAGTGLLTVEHPAVRAVGGLLAFGGGWGWAGLLHYLASASYPGQEGPATAITQMGVSLGGAIGPLGFGLLVDTAGNGAGWWTMTGVGLAAYLCVRISARQAPDRPHPSRSTEAQQPSGPDAAT